MSHLGDALLLLRNSFVLAGIDDPRIVMALDDVCYRHLLEDCVGLITETGAGRAEGLGVTFERRTEGSQGG